MAIPSDDVLTAAILELGRVDAVRARFDIQPTAYYKHLRGRPGLKERLREAQREHKRRRAIEWIKAWHRERGRLPSFDDTPHRDSITRLFGSWNAAIEAAGFTPRQPGPPGLYDDQLEKAASVLVGRITDQEAAEKLGIKPGAVRRRRQRLGFEKPLAAWTPERVIAEMRRWADLYGGAPAAHHWNPAQMRWRNRAYAEGRAVGRFSDETMAEIDRRHREDGPWPTTSTVLKVFGSWNAGIVAAGFEPVPKGGGRRGVKVASA